VGAWVEEGTIQSAKGLMCESTQGVFVRSLEATQLWTLAVHVVREVSGASEVDLEKRYCYRECGESPHLQPQYRRGRSYEPDILQHAIQTLTKLAQATVSHGGAMQLILPGAAYTVQSKNALFPTKQRPLIFDTAQVKGHCLLRIDETRVYSNHN